MSLQRALIPAAAVGLLAACSSAPELDEGGPPDSAASGGTEEAEPTREEEPTPEQESTPEHSATARTTVLLEMPAGSTEQEREAAARTLAVRAQAIASGAWVEVEGDELIVVLPQVAERAAGEALVRESVLSLGAVIETRTPEHPDWPGCVGQDADADMPVWVCEDDEETAHLVDSRSPIRRPSAVELTEHGVNFDFTDADVVRLTELTAELACERDAGRPGMMAVLAGSRLLLAAAMRPAVECGRGLTQGSVSLSLGPDWTQEETEQFADALRSSFDVVPEVHTIQVVGE